jgi:hypothetical protein
VIFLDFGRRNLSLSSPKKDGFAPRSDSFVQIGKRFVKTSQDDGSSENDANASRDLKYERHERSKAYFAKAYAKEVTRENEIEKERRGRRQAQVRDVFKEKHC